MFLFYGQFSSIILAIERNEIYSRDQCIKNDIQISNYEQKHTPVISSAIYNMLSGNLKTFQFKYRVYFVYFV